MAIPGLKPEFPVRAKVRIGEKKKSQSGKEYPSSTDYFICDDDEFRRVCGDKPNELTIYLPFGGASDNFPTGLEWWRGKQLTCYSKGEGSPPLAYRVKDMVGDAEVRGELMGRDRLPITCPVRDCPILKKKDCKPMGRLQFFIEGIDRKLGVFQLDTKSWNSVEAIEGALAVLGDVRGVALKLRVHMEQKGTSKFPVLTLEASEVEINDANDVALADALIQLDKDKTRENLAAVLDLTNPGWRDNPDVIERIKAAGVEAAAKAMLEKHLV